jgi:hypothetical protein
MARTRQQAFDAHPVPAAPLIQELAQGLRLVGPY